MADIHLTDAERESLLRVLMDEYEQTWAALGSFRRVSTVVERIVSDRLAAQKAATDATVRVSLWHDTTMWNEGFDQAQRPYSWVDVAEDDADDLMTWAESTLSLENFANNGGHRYLGFDARREHINDSAGVLALAQAKKALMIAARGFDGP